MFSLSVNFEVDRHFWFSILDIFWAQKCPFFKTQKKIWKTVTNKMIYYIMVTKPVFATKKL